MTTKNIFQLVGKIKFIKNITAFAGLGGISLSGKRLLCVAGDLGGWHAAAVVLAKLADGGADVSVVFTGPSRRAFGEKSLEIDSRFVVREKEVNAVGAIPAVAKAMVGRHESPLHERYDVLIVAPSQSKDGNVETVKIVNEVKDNVPVCVIEDMWGSAVPFLNKIKPNILKRTSVCTIDQFAKKMLVEETKIKAKKVFVTGGPQFDRVLELRKNWDEQRKMIRKNVVKSGYVYLVAGGVNGTDEILDLVRPVLRAQDVVIFRQHSRSTVKDRKRSEKAIEKIKQMGGKFLDVDKKIAPYTESILPGADFVLSGFSTTNRYAIMLGIVGTIYVGTKSFQKDLWTEKKLKLPPEVEFGAGWYVRNAKEMKKVIEEISVVTTGKRKQNIIKKQQKIAQFCDGKAAERVVEAIHRLS